MITIFIIRVRYEELDGAMAQPVSICRVAAGLRVGDPLIAAPGSDSVTLLRAAEHQPVRWAGWSLADWLLAS